MSNRLSPEREAELEHWRDFLEQPKGSAVRRELERSLRENYDELLRTFPALESFHFFKQYLPQSEYLKFADYMERTGNLSYLHHPY